MFLQSKDENQFIIMKTHQEQALIRLQISTFLFIKNIRLQGQRSATD